MSGRRDAGCLLEAIERLHPDPFRSVTPDTLRGDAERAAAVPAGERSRAIVELMRLGALLDVGHL